MTSMLHAQSLPPTAIAETSDIRVSATTAWSDDVWRLDVAAPGAIESDYTLVWSFSMPSGGHFTDRQWRAWSDAAKTFLWSLHSTPPIGRRSLRTSTLIGYFFCLRVLIRWMADEGHVRFSDLDIDAGERFLAWVADRPGRNRRPLSRSTIAGYAELLNLLHLQRHLLPNAPNEDFRTSDRFSRLLRYDPDNKLPATPDDVAVSLVSAAIRLIGEPAEDILALRDLAQRGAHVGRRRVAGALSRYRFSTIAGEQAPWRTTPVSNRMTVKRLVARLYDACFVVIAYLVGARVSEILGLKIGCIEEVVSADGSETITYLSGRIYKTAASPLGDAHRWMAPAPVIRAIAVLERLSAPVRHATGRDDLWLMPAADRFHAPALLRTATIIEHLNGPFAALADLPLHKGEPWRLSTHQGRKTFARFVGRRDRTGLYALAAHFGHVTRVMTDAAYVGVDFELDALIDAEVLEETRRALEDLLSTTQLAGKAGRALSAHSRFRGRTRDGDLQGYVDFILTDTDMRLGVCDWGYCVYRRETSACLGGDGGPNPVLRTQSTCATCANFAVTTKHRPVWSDRRQRNLDLLAQPALDARSRALAIARVEECNRILADLDRSGAHHDPQ